ncbi:hypothetical protein [Micromonospora thermarum]|uniref:Uncharacterized protein n=1 Tax=Micromonospora thermarum TaxID=2720024 RepID=A0ABX0Z4B7_9ACTN|nr:hypothetical protein [Micromonospora thermarum]NJP31814.1 hypothetical protein [Micromonospora thermarum]
MTSHGPSWSSPEFTTVHSGSPSCVQRDAYTRPVPGWSASGTQSSARSHAAWLACTRRMARSTARSRSFQPTQTPKTLSHTSTPTPLSQAECSSSRWLRCHRRVWCSTCRRSNHFVRSTPGTSPHRLEARLGKGPAAQGAFTRTGVSGVTAQEPDGEIVQLGLDLRVEDE